ncbi:MAG TPA: PQQ-dependent sugar dehydrogenase [Solirubrobacterales bacterium]|jgi:hypothetical protein|nr:PQQ-dependent sugar dehydrogenase [Solirubrobacterales bacterium]
MSAGAKQLGSVVAAVAVATVFFATAAPAAKKPAKAPPRPPVGDGSGGFALTEVGSFDRPVHADNAPGTRHTLYVVESEGVISVLSGSTILPQPFLDISDLVRCCGEEGMLSVAFHPKYRRNRLFYVYFTDNNGDQQLMEFKRKKKRKFVAMRASGRVVLRIPHPDNGNHNGGQLQFGPDGLLYIAPGDGGSGGDPPNNAQNPDSLLGKVLRIDPRKQPSRCAKKKKGKPRKCFGPFKPYGAARGNPFAMGPGRDEIYALGLRNPFRFSFDALTGALAIGDVGQGCREEIDYRGPGRALGANFGWSRYEGTRVFNGARTAPGAIFPIHEYDNSGGNSSCPLLNNGFEGIAVIAGYVVRDERLNRQYGRLLYTDTANDQIRSLVPSESGAIDEQATGMDLPGFGMPFSFAEGFRDTLFVISGNGPVYRLDPG